MKNDKGELTQDHPLVQFLLKPNKHQNFKEFGKDFIRNLYAAGYSYLLPTSENDAYIRRFDKMDSDLRPELRVLNTDFIDYTNLSSGEASDLFRYCTNSTQETLDYNNIIPFWDEAQDPDNFRIGVSRLCSLEDNIKNIILANRAKTNKIKQSGKFIATPSTKSLNNTIGNQLDQMVSADNPNYKQRDLLEDKIETTGFGYDKAVMVTKQEIDVLNVMEGIQDYSYDKEVLEDKRTVKNTYKIPRELQNIGDDQSKYENRKEAFLELFTLTVLSLADNFTESIQEFYAPNEKDKLILDYSHHPAFEIVEDKKQVRKEGRVDTLIKLLDKGIITVNEAKEKLEHDKII